MPNTDLKTALERALNLCKDDPLARHALEHVLKHGERYYLLMEEDALPSVLALARNVALKDGEERSKGVTSLMPSVDGGKLARAVLRLAKLVDTATEQVKLRDLKIAELVEASYDRANGGM